MKKALLIAVLSAVCGCCSVTICRDGGKDMVEIENSGWKFLGLAPIASGDPEYPNRDVCIWFCDSLLLDVNMMLLDDAMRANGYSSFRNISSFQTRENAFLIFSRQTYHTSAELVK